MRWEVCEHIIYVSAYCFSMVWNEFSSAADSVKIATVKEI